MNSLKKAFSLSLIASIFTLFTPLLSPFTVHAHRSHADCSGSSLGIILYTDHPRVNLGDTIKYSVRIANGTAGAPLITCDATGLVASLITPDGTIHPITLSRTILANLESDYYENVASYVSRVQDLRADGSLDATATVTGIIHQNDTDSQGGGNQQVNVIVNIPVPPVQDNSVINVVVTSTPPPPPPPPPVINFTSGGSGFVPLIPTPLPTPIIPPTILVSVPILPHTGIGPRSKEGPKEKNTLWNLPDLIRQEIQNLVEKLGFYPR